MVKGYKGFDKDMSCRGFQYEVGGNYELDGEARCCGRGFHFCERALDALRYYAPASSRYCEVEAGGDIDRVGDKCAATKIRIVRELTLAELAAEAVKQCKDKVSGASYCKTATNTGYGSAATNTGDGSAAEVKGAESVAVATGRGSKAAGALGCWIVLTERGEEWEIKEVKAFKVDGEAIKPGVFYELKGGEAVEA